MSVCVTAWEVLLAVKKLQTLAEIMPVMVPSSQCKDMQSRYAKLRHFYAVTKSICGLP